MFKAGRCYRHSCAKDLDIHVLKVQYVGKSYTKLRVYYVNMYTGNILTRENVTLQKSDFEAWTEVKDNLPFTTEHSLETISIDYPL